LSVYGSRIRARLHIARADLRPHPEEPRSGVSNDPAIDSGAVTDVRPDAPPRAPATTRSRSMHGVLRVDASPNPFPRQPDHKYGTPKTANWTLCTRLSGFQFGEAAFQFENRPPSSVIAPHGLFFPKGGKLGGVGGALPW